MAITIVTTACDESNSYCTLAEVNTYMEGVPWFDSTWDALSDAVKNSWLVFAARAIDRLKLKGSKYDNDQSMEFPRTVTDDYTDEGYVPQKVKDAQCEMIIWLYNHVSIDDGSPEREIDSVALGRGALEVVFSKFVSNNRDLAGGYPETVKSLLVHWVISSSNFTIRRG